MAKCEVISAASGIPKGREISYADHAVLAARNTISLHAITSLHGHNIPNTTIPGTRHN